MSAVAVVSVVVPRFRVLLSDRDLSVRLFDADIIGVDEQGVTITLGSWSAFDEVQGVMVAGSKRGWYNFYPYLYPGDLNLQRDWAGFCDVTVEGPQDAVQAMVDRFAAAEVDVDRKHVDAEFSVMFWGVPSKALDVLMEEFQDVLVDNIFGFSFHGVFRKRYVHGKAFLGEDKVRVKAFLDKVESFEHGAYVVNKHTVEAVAR